MESKFSMRLLERLWMRLATVFWYGEAKRQAKPKIEEVIFISEAIMTLFC